MLLRQWYRVMVVAVDLPFTAVLVRGLRWLVPEVHGGPPATPARAEEQRVHDGAGHELDDARRARLLARGAARAGGLAGRTAAPVRRRRRHRQRVHFVREVVVAVGQLGEGLQGVFVGGARVARLRGGPPRGQVVGGPGAVSQLDGWWVLGEWLCTTRPTPYRF